MTDAHRSSGRWQIGLLLTLVTCTLWGVLPIAAKGVLQELDPYTLNFYRFAIAGLLLWPYLARRRQIPPLSVLKRGKTSGWVLLCGLFLAGNYTSYILAVERMTPGGAQVLIQLAVVLFLISSVVLFKESFSARQWSGCLLFVVGLLVFFHRRILAMADGFDAYAVGMGLMVLSACSWACYASLQKQLLTRFTSPQIMLMLYGLGTIGFLPWSEPLQILQLSSPTLLLLLFCGASTLIGSGSFSEALAHWEGSRISAVLATTPLFTLTFMWGLSFYPGFAIEQEPLTPVVLSGALMVVLGAALVAVSRAR